MSATQRGVGQKRGPISLGLLFPLQLAHLARLAAMVVMAALAGVAWPQIVSATEPTVVNASVGGSQINVYFYKPGGAGPFPLLILSHGTPRDPSARADYGPQTERAQAEAYVKTGVAVAVPIRRGFGSSGGWGETRGACRNPDYYGVGLYTAQDVRAAIAAVSTEPGVDPSRIVLMGVSAGGWASIAAATQGGVLGVVNFAGGRGSAGPDNVCAEDRLVEAASRFGSSSQAPELWIYSRNDHYFGPELAKRMFEAFSSAGGRATFISAPAYGDDGHHYFRDVAAWKPEVDAFLRRIGFLR